MSKLGGSCSPSQVYCSDPCNPRADERGVFEVSIRAGADRRRTESGQGGNIWMDQRHGSEKQTGAKTKWWRKWENEKQTESNVKQNAVIYSRNKQGRVCVCCEEECSALSEPANLEQSPKWCAYRNEINHRMGGKGKKHVHQYIFHWASTFIKWLFSPHPDFYYLICACLCLCVLVCVWLFQSGKSI